MSFISICDSIRISSFYPWCTGEIVKQLADQLISDESLPEKERSALKDLLDCAEKGKSFVRSRLEASLEQRFTTPQPFSRREQAEAIYLLYKIVLNPPLLSLAPDCYITPMMVMAFYGRDCHSVQGEFFRGSLLWLFVSSPLLLPLLSLWSLVLPLFLALLMLN